MNGKQGTNDIYFSINSPIGYSRAPIQYYPSSSPIPKQQSSSASSSSSSSSTSSSLSLSSSLSFPQYLTFDKLPNELLINIISKLSQFELVNLCRVNKKFHQLSYSKLFENIIIDSKFNIFDKEFNTNNVTYINSSYNLKKFIRLINDHKGEKIFSISCISFPEAMDIYDNHIFNELTELFSNLNHLKKLIWLYDVFPFEFLYNLKNKDLINILILNIKSNSISNELILKNLNFKNLINFQIQPFYNSNYLINIIDNILINNNNSNLKILGLTRLPSLQAHNHNHHHNTGDDNYSIRNVFERIKFQNLSILSLTDIIVNENDGNLLIKSINLNKLTDLHLRGITELSNQSSFLMMIGQHLIFLKNLSLDIEESIEYLPKFLLILPILSTLDITIRKQSTFETYSSAITRHKEKLYKLSLELINLEDILINDIPDLFYLSLSKLINLNSLRINSTNGLLQEPIGLLNLISSLSNLKFLEIFGNQAGGMPNLGLDMIHPTIFDGWFKVQHVVFIYLKQNKNLKYIKINDYLFECDYNKSSVSPKDGINNWFNMNVRVNMMLYLSQVT